MSGMYIPGASAAARHRRRRGSGRLVAAVLLLGALAIAGWMQFAGSESEWNTERIHSWAERLLAQHVEPAGPLPEPMRSERIRQLSLALSVATSQVPGPGWLTRFTTIGRSLDRGDAGPAVEWLVRAADRATGPAARALMLQHAAVLALPADVQRGWRFARKAVELSAQDPSLWRLVALAAAENGDLVAAEAALWKATVHADRADAGGVDPDLRELATLYAARGQYVPALDLRRRSLSTATAPDDRLPAQVDLAILSELATDARRDAETAAALAALRSESPSAVGAESALRLGDFLYERDRDVSARDAYRIVTSRHAGFARRDALVRAHLRLAELLDRDGDPQARFHLDAALVTADPARRAGLLAWYGSQHLRRGDVDGAVAAYQRMLQDATRTGNDEDRAAAYGNLGIAERARGALDLAADMYRRALALDEAANRRAAVATTWGNLALVHQDRGEWTQAIDLLQKALAVNAEFGRLDAIASNYGNLGMLYQQTGNTRDAEEMYLRALRINTELKRQEGVARQLGNLGVLYADRGEWQAAREYLGRALDLFRELGSAASAMRVEKALAELKTEVVQ